MGKQLVVSLESVDRMTGAEVAAQLGRWHKDWGVLLECCPFPTTRMELLGYAHELSDSLMSLRSCMQEVIVITPFLDRLVVEGLTAVPGSRGFVLELFHALQAEVKEHYDWRTVFLDLHPDASEDGYWERTEQYVRFAAANRWRMLTITTTSQVGVGELAKEVDDMVVRARHDIRRRPEAYGKGQ